ncbi:hypothetical protein IAU60_001607 [Kwoniella sp. DSM 27419]
MPKRRAVADESKNKKIEQHPSGSRRTPLPNEVIAAIMAILLITDRRALAICCRVSLSFFALAAPILYTRIQISSFSQSDSRLDLGVRKPDPTGAKPAKRFLSKKQLLKNARVVQIDSHQNTLCVGKSYSNKKIHTLTLRFLSVCMGPTLHYADPLSERQCSLVKGLRPKKLVLDNMTLFSLTGFPWGTPSHIYDCLEELVLICPPLKAGMSNISGGWPREMKELKRFTIMFCCAPRQRLMVGGTGAILDAFIELILAIPACVPFHIVNAGCLQFLPRDTEPWIYRQVEQRFEADLKKAMLADMTVVRRPIRYNESDDDEQMAQSPDKAAQRLAVDQRFATIRFIGMKEHLNEHGWTGELPYEEAKDWLGWTDEET